MSGSQSLERGLSILEMIDRSDEPLGVREIARRAGFSPAIVQRLLNTLSKHGYADQLEDTRRYRIGYRALGLGRTLGKQDRLIASATEELRGLATRNELNAFLGVLRDQQAVYALVVQSAGPIAINVTSGQNMPLHSTAIGKTLLASLPDEEVLALLGRSPMRKITARTVTDPAQLLKQLRSIRKTNVAVVIEENLPGVISIGAPVRDRGGKVIAAVSVSFARSISPDVGVSKATEVTIEAAKRISLNCGCPNEFLSFARAA